VKLAADECCDALLVAGLRRNGHDVWYVMESARGLDDVSILRQVAAEERVLVTEDKDFGELVVRLGLPAHGVVLLRIEPADSDAKLLRLREVLNENAARLAGSFTVVDRWKTRFRPLRPP
jgi:predicted nuclease of predicted toxin-antitoxin system